MSDFSDIFGEVIYTYSTKQAIAEGFLVDISANYPELVNQSPICIPIIFTSELYGLIEQAVKSDNCNDYEGVIWDILFMASISIKSNIDTDFIWVNIVQFSGEKTGDIVKSGKKGEIYFTGKLINMLYFNRLHWYV